MPNKDPEKRKEYQRKRYLRDKEKIKKRMRDYRKNNIETVMVTKAKQRSKERGVPCTITADDLVIPEFCPILGIKIELNERGSADSSPSIDRIDNTKGYVPGNVQVISHRANRIKAHLTEEEIVALARYVTRNKVTL